MKHTKCEHMYVEGKSTTAKDYAVYHGPLSPLEQLERIAKNEDSAELLVWGSETGTKVWRWIQVGDLQLSVQGSHCHYCNPRWTHGPYTHLEVQVNKGQVPKHWEEWNTDPGDAPGHGPYAEVPVEEIRKLIEQALSASSTPHEQPRRDSPPDHP